MKALIKYGADPNVIPASVKIKKVFEMNVEMENEPLLLVIARRCPNIYERGFVVLLKHGANVDIQNENGDTFLHCMANISGISASTRKILNIYLDYSPNLNIQNNMGETALHILCKKGDSFCAETTLDFIAFGCDVNISDNSGKKPLEYLSNTRLEQLIKQVSKL